MLRTLLGRATRTGGACGVHVYVMRGTAAITHASAVSISSRQSRPRSDCRARRDHRDGPSTDGRRGRFSWLALSHDLEMPARVQRNFGRLALGRFHLKPPRCRPGWRRDRRQDRQRCGSVASRQGRDLRATHQRRSGCRARRRRRESGAPSCPGARTAASMISGIVNASPEPILYSRCGSLGASSAAMIASATSST
jgi:hypothetical protein